MKAVFPAQFSASGFTLAEVAIAIGIATGVLAILTLVVSTLNSDVQRLKPYEATQRPAFVSSSTSSSSTPSSASSSNNSSSTTSTTNNSTTSTTTTNPLPDANLDPSKRPNANQPPPDPNAPTTGSTSGSTSGSSGTATP